MRKGKFTNHYLGLTLLTLVLVACATQKSRYDQSKIGKIYHDVTAKYNGYFNANEIIEESILELNAQHRDNYTDILELYPYRAAPNPEAVAARLDTAIKKVSVVATLHEASQWVDDCYLLIGKAYYLKQDFESAENALEFFMDEFNPDGTRITKRKRKLKPSRQSAAKSKAQSEKARKKLAKQQERERKKYNKELRRKKKKSSRKGGSEAPTERKTARDQPLSPLSLEAQQKNKPEDMAVPKSGDENPGGLKHVPAHQEASLWLARIYVDRENYPAAERILNRLKGNPNLQDAVARELPVVWAYYALKRKNYAGAIPHLQSAIELASKRSERARLAFILGQIAERDKDFPVAIDYYERVLQNNPGYTLGFNARLNLARARMESGAESVEDMIRQLERMLRDDKNTEYLDQIYFALAQISLRQNNIPEAIANLQLAASHGSANPTQLTETNFQLAELYYQNADYINAKATYDATLTTMLKTDERYRYVDRLSKNLTEIAMHLSTIQLQDSLLRISMMSEAERLALAKQLYKPQAPPQAVTVKQGKDIALGGKPAALPGGQLPSRPTAGASTLTSNFFAYDQKQVKRGQREFEHTWGDRPLSDNWRLQALVERNSTFEDETSPDAPLSEILTDQDLSKIFRGVPQSDEEKVAAHEAIQNAMLQLGSLYRDKLEDYPLSIRTLESLLTKYAETKYKLDALYQLYLSHLALEQYARAEYYKNLIINDFAGSKYAMVLIDPDYMSKQLTEEQRLDRDYQEVYALIENGAFKEAYDRIILAKSTFGTNHRLQPRYSILEAMCIGNLEGKDAYVEALKLVIGSYPGTPEEIKARDMLLLLDAYQGSKLNLKTSSAPNYKLSMDAQHFILIQVSGYKDSDAQDVKVAISNYNRKYHSLAKLKISSMRFNTQGDQVIILVRSFKDGAAAMKYLAGVEKNQSEFVPAGTQFEVFAVTQQNYREIVAQKSIDSYRTFYEENYRS